MAPPPPFGANSAAARDIANVLHPYTDLKAHLEVGPMIALIRWRGAVARGGVPDTRAASRFARISFVQGILVVLMVLAATAMARGYGVSQKG